MLILNYNPTLAGERHSDGDVPCARKYKITVIPARILTQISFEPELSANHQPIPSHKYNLSISGGHTPLVEILRRGEGCKLRCMPQKFF